MTSSALPYSTAIIERMQNTELCGGFFQQGHPFFAMPHMKHDVNDCQRWRSLKCPLNIPRSKRHMGV